MKHFKIIKILRSKILKCEIPKNKSYPCHLAGTFEIKKKNSLQFHVRALQSRFQNLFFFLFEAICLDQGSANLFIEGQIVSILDFVVHSAVVGTAQLYS